MDESTVAQSRLAVEEFYRAESRRVLATLIRLLGDFDLAEEALHDAFASAVEHWPREGVPANPRARRSSRSPPGARRPRRTVPTARPNRRRPRVLSTGLALAHQEPERRFLEKRIRELS